MMAGTGSGLGMRRIGNRTCTSLFVETLDLDAESIILQADMFELILGFVLIELYYSASSS
jgi:hypothetical protein